jgi:DNA-binding LacI/PurR family transcriptional regulator
MVGLDRNSMKTLSFHVRARANGSLTEQVVQGIQAVVHTGRFASGERLPTLSDMSAELGVSMNTVRRAVGRLAAEGVLEVRRSTGIRVRTTHEPRFRAHVLYVSQASPSAFYYAARNQAFLEVLRGHRLHATTVHVSAREHVQGFPTVRHVLATQPVTLAVLDGETLGNDRRLRKLLDARGVRFVQKWARKPSPAAVDSLFLDFAPAYRQLARHCAHCGIKEVLFFSGLDEPWMGFRDAARSLGLRAKREAIDLKSRHETSEVRHEREGYATLTRWLKRGRIERGKAMLVTTDDYFARGAMFAILEAGWRVPRDLQFATTVNDGQVPVMGMPLTRIEMHPVRDGEAMAQVVLRNLPPNQRKHPPLVVCPQFVAGKSTRPRARPC